MNHLNQVDLNHCFFEAVSCSLPRSAVGWMLCDVPLRILGYTPEGRSQPAQPASSVMVYGPILNGFVPSQLQGLCNLCLLNSNSSNLSSDLPQPRPPLLGQEEQCSTVSSGELDSADLTELN